MNKKLIYFIVIITLLTSCQNSKNASNEVRTNAYNFSSLYKPGESIIQPEYYTYINSNNSATFFFKIKIDDLNSLKEISEEKNNNYIYAKYVIRDINTQEIVDSNTYSFKISNDISSKYILNNFNINIPEKNKYRLVVNFYSEFPKYSKRILTFIDNSSYFSSNNFLIESADSTKEILMYNFVKPNKVYKINSEKISSTYVEYYKIPEYSVKPPYSTFLPSEKITLPDSVFSYSIGDSISFKEKGTYVFKENVQSKPSICLVSSGNSYPEVLTVRDMLEPIKLIATNKEYNKINESDNIKQAIDEFWLTKSNNQKFAKEQIRIFYNRVKLANIFFTEDVEGWKTDRGCIYIVFGPPSVVNLSDEAEEWYYGENPNLATLLFIFEKKESQRSKISYQLIRDNMYQPTWGQALSTWKRGRVFSI